MGRFCHFLSSVFITVVGLVVGIGFEPWITLQAAPPAGADFRISESELTHPLRIIAYGDMRFTDPTEVGATNPKVRRWLVDQIAAERPAAVLLSAMCPGMAACRPTMMSFAARRKSGETTTFTFILPSAIMNSRAIRPSNYVLRTGGMPFLSYAVADGILRRLGTSSTY